VKTVLGFGRAVPGFARGALGFGTVVLAVGLGALEVAGQEPAAHMVVSSDPELARMAATLLPDLAERAGLQLREPVRLESRSRVQLVEYLQAKLDEELPVEEANDVVEAYALLGLLPPDLDLRALLLSLYTEQVAGFYEPDSTALFVMDDQPAGQLQGLLVHELVHAIQDQTADLEALTGPDVGNDRATAAQAAIEGHATLVMLEYMTEQISGSPVDLSQIPDFAAQVRPALEAIRGQFPELASAPRVIQESLLFPYIEGAGFVQALWREGERVAPFGPHLPLSTEQVLSRRGADAPVELTLAVTGGRVIHDDVLGSLELGVLLEEHLGPGRGDLAEGWGGDRYALVEGAAGGRGLLWYVLWDDVPARDRFADGMEGALGALGAQATLERVETAARPAVLLRIGELGGVESEARISGG